MEFFHLFELYFNILCNFFHISQYFQIDSELFALEIVSLVCWSFKSIKTKFLCVVLF